MMRIRVSYILAIALAGGISYYMLTGQTVIGGQADASPPTIAERQTEQNDELFAVRADVFAAEERSSYLDIRGRTEAESSVSVRAQTGGIIETRHVEKGDSVNSGDLLCTIETGARRAKVLEANAGLIQAKVDLGAAEKLADRGFSAKNQIPALEAARDAAKARLHETELDLERTKIRAPISGIVQDPVAEQGEMLRIGDICVTLIDRNPMIIVGQVSEREIGMLNVAMTASADLATGEEIEGKISYIAPAADAKTRTFRVEITVPNVDGNLKDGVTARARVQLEGSMAHRIPASIMTLADDGRVGVRTLNADNAVLFVPVKIVGGTVDGMWVSGLPEKVRIITVGQEFVTEGQTVRVATKS